MTSSNRLLGYFTPRKRFSNKLPSLYLDCRHSPDDPYLLEVYFVNNSGQTLEWLEVPNSQTVPTIQYTAIKPDEAVKIDELHIVYSSDDIIQLILLWKALGEPVKEVRLFDKGITKLRYNVLEWLPDAS
tara:strand:+ start:1470 stop:1856 length:387 start_codon:yes stop_codon:yes gene_type:complete